MTFDSRGKVFSILFLSSELADQGRIKYRTFGDNEFRFKSGLPGFNHTWQNRDPVCKFPLKIQPESSLGA